ncbi:MAG: recombinase family protein [Muribaculaceae bacterium]|nr:recombinase family protein [Muribaculaceae bacterium]
MATKAFLRVSTVLQDTEKNKIDILQFANRMKLGNVEFTEEKVSGKFSYKYRKLGALLDSMQSGDILIVPELSRIARSTIQILEVIQLTQDKGITMYSLKENFCNMDNSIASTVTKTIFALVAQIERELISLRTTEGLRAKKLAGVKLGRPRGKGKSKLDPHTEDIMKLVSLGVPKTLIAKQYNTSVGNLYNFIHSIQQ